VRPLVSWFRSRTLRLRVTLAATAVVAVAVVVGGAGMLIGVQRSLVNALDAGVLQRAKDVVALAEHGTLRDPIPAAGDGSGIVQVISTSGQVIAGSAEVEGNGPAVAVPLPAALAAQEPVTLTGLPIGEGGRFRAVALPVRVAGTPAYVFAAVSLAQTEHTMSSLLAALLVGGPGLVLLVAGTTWLLAGYTLRSVDALRGQVTEITATDLHRRVRLPPSRDEVYRLAETLNDMLARLERASVTQRRFVADAAHELRSPLTAMRAQLEVLLRHPDGSAAAGLAGSLLEDTLRISALVEDLLALARSEDPSWRRPMLVVDLDELVLAEVRRLGVPGAAPIAAGGVSAGRVLGDPEGLRRVVRNLLANAQRHATSRVRVTLTSQDGWVELAVSDDGPGIPPEQRAAIFDRFTRLDAARSRDAGGSGLGLAIVRGVITAHAGEVFAEQDAPPAGGGLGGARLVVRLPAAGDGAEDADPAMLSPPLAATVSEPPAAGR